MVWALLSYSALWFIFSALFVFKRPQGKKFAWREGGGRKKQDLRFLQNPTRGERGKGVGKWRGREGRREGVFGRGWDVDEFVWTNGGGRHQVADVLMCKKCRKYEARVHGGVRKDWRKGTKQG